MRSPISTTRRTAAPAHDLQREQFGPVLGADAERVLVPRGDRKHGRLAFALQEALVATVVPILTAAIGASPTEHQRRNPADAASP